jgi:hypothetical protein
LAASGQKHALPHCNSNGRFTSISGHKVDVLIAHRLPTPSGETALGPAMTQCRPADTSSVLPEPFEPIRRQSRVAHSARRRVRIPLAAIPERDATAWRRRSCLPTRMRDRERQRIREAPSGRQTLFAASNSHRPQFSSASRLTAGAVGFLLLIQSGERPER